MVFNSYKFVLAFMPIFMIGMNIVRGYGRKKGNQKLFCELWIILMSLAFFASFGVKNMAILFISVVWNVCTSIPMSFMRDQGAKVKLFGKELEPHKAWLCLGVSGNLVLLLFFKLSGIYLPLAISFYTFNQISYIVDLCRGEVERFDAPEYLSYVLFFPKLLQGPLMSYSSFTGELEKVAVGGRQSGDGREVGDSQASSVDWEKIMRGLLLFSMGLFKKVILADTFGKAVDFGFGGVATLGSLEALLTAVFYSFQLYFDFSGYCDMASALCMMIGFDLVVNFDSPYQAVNIIDFWKRWHITLTKFFTKYVYIPLGGNRRGVARTYVNLMIIFLISGFWHGTGWTFIVWGAMHGVLYVITRMLEKRGAGAGKSAGKNNAATGQMTVPAESGVSGSIVKACKVTLTFLYVTAAWVFFRAETVGQALTLFARMFVGGAKPLATGFSSCFQLDELWYVLKVTPLMKLSFAWDLCLWIFLVVSVFIIFFRNNALKTVRECKIGVGSTLITAILLIWSIISFGGVSTFLYMNF
ncbi:MAG: MBOAT family protein [Butyrivibrio sp.]|nr:MBOAT family protein [Butyrivibrio sp.]